MAVKVPKDKKSVPEGLWTKCDICHEIIYNKELDNNYKVCPKCGHYFVLSAYERINYLIEKGTFIEYDKDMEPGDPLGFKALISYKDKVKHAQIRTGLKEAVITGEGKIGRHKCMICALDFNFLGGSMASVVGEKITRAVEEAIKKKCPVIIISSSGGARMHEGILSLMQMAKTSAALKKLSEAQLPYISILTNPTTGGVTASFASLGDIIIAEPKALIGFAGPRVIEQTIRQKLPKGFQRAEFALEHGLIDIIVKRNELKKTLEKLLDFFKHT